MLKKGYEEIDILMDVELIYIINKMKYVDYFSELKFNNIY